MKFIVQDAQQQARTIRDVPIEWVRPKPPSKKAGRVGTRKAWKRKNPPHWVYAYREPEDVLVFRGQSLGAIYGRHGHTEETAILTPLQKDALDRATKEQDRFFNDSFPASPFSGLEPRSGYAVRRPDALLKTDTV